MSRPCSICESARVNEINEALIAKVSYRDIAERYGTNKTSVGYHRKHLPKKLAKAIRHRETAEVATRRATERARRTLEVTKAATTLGRIEALMTRCERIAGHAERERKWTSAISALREVRAACELLAELSGELRRGSHVAVGVAVTNDERINEFLQLSREEQEAELSLVIVNVLDNDSTVSEHVRTVLNERARLRDTLKSEESLAITADAATGAAPDVLGEASQNRDVAKCDSQNGGD